MCLMLYIATGEAIPLRRGEAIHIDVVDASRAPVLQWFSMPHVREIGSHHGCGCGFPSVIANEPIEYFDGFFDDAREDREKDLQSVRELFRVIAAVPGDIELFPVWDGDQSTAPKGVIELRKETLTPETFFFTEQFLYRVTERAENR